MKLSPKQREALNLVADGKFFPCLVKEEDGWYARWRALGLFDPLLNNWVDSYIREAAMTRLTEDAEEQHHETLHDAWILALRSRTGRVIWDEAECALFAEELTAWSGNATEDIAARNDLTFVFKPSSESKSRFRLSCKVPRTYRRLRALGQAVYVWAPLAGLRLSSSKASTLEVILSRTEAEDFVHDGARNLLDAGYHVTGIDLKATITATAEIPARASATRPVNLTVRVDGEVVTAAEIRFLLEQGSSLVFFRDRWIEIDRNILKEALRALEKGVDRKTNPLVFALGLGHIGHLEIEQVAAHGWLRGLVHELRQRGTFAAEASSTTLTVPNFVGELRDYQQRGVEWLTFLTSHGFGALLADDMGLGKTIQVIAWLLMEPRPRPALIVAPLTLLANWRHELRRFAPSLRVYVHQGENRHVASGFARTVKDADVTLTSYNLLVKDYSSFAEVEWQALVLDEAQAIKNPTTQVARAVRALTPKKRLALTGTPIENSVADLWSIEEFLNPGFLGDYRAFAERFVRPIAADGVGAASQRLRHALEPFILRRLKTDPRIAAELGEKREIREYCELSPEQRREYETALAEFRALEHTSGEVFALITRLKLICDGAGKLERLVELVTSIFEAGESALVFTQYAKVGHWLCEELEKRFGRRFPFLHGGLSAREREDAVRAFQTSKRPNLFLLSLKAGGFGLNLTKATHVIHFDRWWNPAVEAQATDRAHRIGQSENVFVHLFVSAGTLEEHVDDILRQKSRLANSIITEAEWLEAAKLDE